MAWLAAAWVALEGQLPTQLARDIPGSTQTLGHLLPETLGVQRARCASNQRVRIVRIAVHPDAQEQGIGTRLVRTILTHARAAHVECVHLVRPRGSYPFGEAGFKLSRLGVKRGSSSGLFSAVMSSPSPQRAHATLSWRDNFHTRGLVIPGPWSSRELDVGGGLKDCAGGSPAPIADADLIDVAGFALGARPFEAVFDAVQRFVRAVADDLAPWGASRPLNAGCSSAHSSKDTGGPMSSRVC